MLEKLKEHPLYAVLGGVALFVLIRSVLIRSVSGGTSGGGVQYIQSGPSDAVQAASIAASAQQSQAQAALNANAQTTQAQYALGIAGLNEKQITELAQTSAAVDVAHAQFDASTQAAIAQENVAKAQVAGAVALAQTQTAGQVSVANTAAATQAQISHDQISGQVAIAGINETGAAHIADVNNATAQAQTAATLAAWNDQINAAAIANNNATAIAINHDNQAKDLALHTLDTQTRLVQIAAGVTNHSTDANLAAALAGISATENIAHDQTNAQFQESQNYINHLDFNLGKPNNPTPYGNTWGGILAGAGSVISGLVGAGAKASVIP